MKSAYFIIDLISMSCLKVNDLDELKVELICSIKHRHGIDHNIMNLFVGKEAEYLKLENGVVKIFNESHVIHKDLEGEFMRIITSIFYLISYEKWTFESIAKWYCYDNRIEKIIQIRFNPDKMIPEYNLKENLL